MNSLLPLNEKKELHLLDSYFGKRIDKLNSLNLQTHPLFVEKKYLKLLSHILEIDITGLNESEARKLLSLFIDLKKYAGTVYVLKKVLAIFSNKVVLKEWFSYGGEPYHFKVELENEDEAIDDKFYAKLESIINKYKNVRSILEKIDVVLKSSAKYSYKMATLSGESISVLPYQATSIETKLKQNYFLAVKQSEMVSLTLKIGEI